MTSEEQSLDAIAYKVDFKFDNSFRPIRRTISSWDFDLTRIDMAYQDDDKPVKVGDLKLNYESVSGRLATTVLGKVRDARIYDSYGNLISYRAAYYPGTKCNNSEDKNSCAKELYSFILTRDSINRITTKVEKINGETTSYGYSYDSSGRLSSVTFPQSLLRSRLSKTLVICDLQFIWDLLELKNWWKDLKTVRLVLSTRNLPQILRAFSGQLT